MGSSTYCLYVRSGFVLVLTVGELLLCELPLKIPFNNDHIGSFIPGDGGWEEMVSRICMGYILFTLPASAIMTFVVA